PCGVRQLVHRALVTLARPQDHPAHRARGAQGDRRMSRLVLGALALRPHGSGVQTYERELIHALSLLDGLPDLAAVVQEDTTATLPADVTPLPRPVCSG